VTDVALPPNVFPATVNGVVPQMLPLFELRETMGGFTHPQVTANVSPVAAHPSGVLTVKMWFPLGTLLKTGLYW